MRTESITPCDRRANGGQVPFWNANFLVALAGYFFLYMSVSMFFLLPLFLGTFNPSQKQIGLIMGIHSLVAISIRPFFGRLIDQRGGKKVAVLGLFLLIVVVPLFHLVRDAGWLPLGLSALRGLGWGVSMTATIAVCSDLTPVERLAHSIGIIGVAGLVANALGPLAGEWIIEAYGFGGLFNASLLFLVASAVCLLLTREPIKPVVAQKGKSSFRIFRSIPVVVLLVVAAMPVFHGSIRGAMIYFIAVFAESIGIGRIGPFFLAFSAAAILTRFGIGDISDRVGRKKVILPAALIISANLVLISQVRSEALLIVTGFIGGLGQGLIYPALNAYLIDFLGLENKALAISLYLSLFDIGMGLGSPFYGSLADLWDYRRMYLFAAFLLALSSIFFALKAPSTNARTKSLN